MPHQCLSCGFLFEEGSSQLLAGCPECKGTRFFYTKQAVGDERRQELADQAKKDLRQVVADLLSEQAPETAKAAPEGEGWAELRPRDLRKLIKQVQAEQRDLAQQAPGTPTHEAHGTGETDEADKADESALAKSARRRLAEIKAQVDDAARDPEAAKPDTVTVRESGDYEIDVKGLLEKNPIVVHKDGTYLIHLPSLFDAKGKA